jgi:hypothetical protein
MNTIEFCGKCRWMILRTDAEMVLARLTGNEKELFIGECQEPSHNCSKIPYIEHPDIQCSNRDPGKYWEKMTFLRKLEYLR